MVNWLVYVLLWTLLYALTNLVDKFLLEKKIRSSLSYGVLTGSISLISAIIILFVVGMPTFNSTAFLIALLSGVTFGASYFIYYYLFKFAEASRVVGIIYSYPAFVAVLSLIFLAEKLSSIKYVAIGLAILGAVFLGTEKFKQRLRLTQAFWLAILYAFLAGIVDVSDKYVLGFMNFWQAYSIITITLCLLLILPVFSRKVRKDLAHDVKMLPGAMLSVTCGLSGSIFFLIAASLKPISIVSSLGTLQPVFLFIFTLLLSIFAPRLLKETLVPREVVYKIMGIILVVVAAFILGS